MATETGIRSQRLENIDFMVVNIKSDAVAIADIASQSSTPVAVSAHQHANDALQIEPSWQANRVRLQNTAQAIIDGCARLQELLNNPSNAHMLLLKARLLSMQAAINATATEVNALNQQITQVSSNLAADANTARGLLTAKQQELDTVRDKISRFNSDHTDSVEHFFEAFGKSLVSLGIWPSIELANAQKEADQLNNDLRTTNSDVDALSLMQGPMADLQSSMVGLVADLGNLILKVNAVMKQTDDILQENDDTPDSTSPFFQDEVNTLLADVKDLGSLGAALIA